MIHGWYITVAAVKQFQEICGLEPESDGVQFDFCAVELEKACEKAKLKKDEEHRQIWEVKHEICQRMTRLEIYVSKSKRPEGGSNQVVRVRKK